MGNYPVCKELNLHDQLSSAAISLNYYSDPLYLGDNCVQNFHLERYIVGYTVASRAVKHDIRR